MLASLIGICGLATAVFRDDVGIIDWKLAVYGNPLAVSQYNNSIAAVTSQNIVTVYSPTGEARWRQLLEPHQLEAGVALLEDVVVIGGCHLAAFNASSGSSLWTVDYPARLVYTDLITHRVIVDGIHSVSIVDGTVNALEKDSAAHPYVFEGSVTLPNGTLSISSTGVLTLKNSTETVWTREDGLADAVQAVFLRYDDSDNDENEEDKTVETYLRHAYCAEGYSNSWLEAFTQRSAHHIGQLFVLGRDLVFRGKIAQILLPERPKPVFGFDQVLVVRTAGGAIYGLNVSTQGDVAWVYHDLEPEYLELSHSSAAHAKVKSADGQTYLISYDGEISVSSPNDATPYDNVVVVDGTTLKSTEFDWQITLPGTDIVGRAHRDANDVTALVAMPITDDEVMYKYMNPYAAVFATHNAQTKQLLLTVLDTVTGRILAQPIHSDPVEINEEWPFCLEFGEHWFVYTYLALDDAQTPRVSVGELYESHLANHRVTDGSEIDVFTDTHIPVLKLATWTAPSRGQPVHSLGISKSMFGAMAREVVFGLEHQVVAIAKFGLSALQPLEDLDVPPDSHLSHVFGVSRARFIATSRSNLESTYLVAALGGGDLFVTRSSPSGELDRLNSQFPKIKLLIMVGILAFLVTTLAPLARMKGLREQWR